MNLHFYKYQAAGNDFVLVDRRGLDFVPTKGQIAHLCDRRFGVGADGVILLDADQKADFGMVYINPDGTESLCGNGCRSAVDLASRLGLARHQTVFSAFDGLHQAELLKEGGVRLQMNDVKLIEQLAEGHFMNTGSPHFVRFVTDLDQYPVFEEGRAIRYNPIFPDGANANFVEELPNNTIAIRTYERGVEEETLACGTGATAAALSAAIRGYHSPVNVVARGGKLRVEFVRKGDWHFTDIWLTGPANLVYEGQISI
ncbi:MAG: diaminopimelate epimerase [Cyclobacteriaceae bacterium]|nr:diaminopimelate epimerase [Cyclobacteriaceae bacterium]